MQLPIAPGDNTAAFEQTRDHALGLPRHRNEEAWAAAQSQELLHFVGLDGNKCELAKNLPYGAQRRLEIARALATEPKLLLLDEPAAGMNPSETSDLMALIPKRQWTDFGHRMMDYLARQQARYERAARNPWLHIEPDPPLPK